MKKAFLLFTLITLLFSGCNNLTSSITFEDQSGSKDKALLTICLDDGKSKTAMPVFNWSDFTYELIAVQNPGEPTQKAPVTLFTDRTYEQLIMGIPLEATKYRFTLNAYKNSQKALSGENIVDLSVGNTSLSFMMFPVSKAKGSASVKITYPMDGTVSKIIAYTSDDIFEEKDGIELSSKIVSGKYETSFDVSNLDSNKEQYAIVKFYDSNNALVYTAAESLIIIGGCVSRSKIDLTEDDWHTYLCTVTLKKDNEGWTSSEKTVSLVNKTDSSKIYILTDSAGGKFKASVAEGIYYVYVNGKNTNIEFNSVNKNVDVDYYTVSMTPVKNSTMIPVSGGIDQAENNVVVQKNSSLTYQIKLSKGYETTSVTVKENGVKVDGAKLDTDITIEAVTEKIEITVEGINPIVYTITYSDNGAEFAASKVSKIAYWFKYGSTYTPPVTFTADETVVLPAIENIRKDANYFDAWTDKEGNTVIDTEGVYHNLVLNANWRSAPSTDDTNKIIYANGFNLLIKSNDTKNSQTYIYIDYNGNGIKDQDDAQIKYTNISTGNTNDFTGYELRAGNADGTYVPKSDFTFTMTGGKISAIYGLNSLTRKYPNKSTLNISGTAVIGSITNPNTITNPDSTTTTYADSVKGIMLDTLSAERVYITGQMTNLTDSAKTPYSVTCVTTNDFERTKEHVVAEIANSNFASLANFTCWNVNADNPDSIVYKQILLSHREEMKNSITKTYIRMADDSGIVLPHEDDIAWDDLNSEFHIGAESINKPCSVFSISVENGTFRVNERTTITHNKTDLEKQVERSLSYMTQPTPLTYDEKFEFDQGYVYMQVMSFADLLTPLIVNDFLSQVMFKKIDESKPIKVTINIETIPASFILGNGDGHGGPEFKYFNGSFYKRFYYGNDETTNYNTSTKQLSWSKAYNKSKQKIFNGLKGYLMNITSEVENNYIYDTYYKLFPDQLSWAGGATFVPVATTSGKLSGNTVSWWDQDVTSSATTVATAGARNLASKWYWQSGPEAGMCFWNTPVANDEVNAANGKIDGVFERWNNSQYLHPDVYDPNVNSTDSTKLLKGRICSEPNGKVNTETINGEAVNVTDEPCLQFLAGKLLPNGKEEQAYIANGYWNNVSDAKEQRTDGWGCSGYIVEFTPYETEYGKQVANYQAIRRTASYN
ncbi:MAG: hypothetical protein MJ184_06435 [Treponema sp.]|uniref:hypothetical protein n=1 Tax=Treponema sp. TaxID=166 RepID=UPI00298E6A59|nr:hypothetical protein [Treponema sp.]MCQ2600981.1 hypothetical protein [Treponema sp.]